MTAGDRDLRDRLVRLARDTPARGDTLDRALAVNRSRRLRAARWVAAAVAVVVLGTSATLARPEAVPDVQTAQATPAGPPPPAVYEQPPRGSLADDPGFLTGVAALPWSPPPSGSGFSRSFDGDSGRVVWAADVPGGHRWAVVMARNGPRWVVNWFAGPQGAAPAEMTEAYGPTGWSRSLPLALMDVSTDTGPLVVLTDPGVAVEYSATLDRAPDGSLVREFVTLPEADGVRLGLVRTPVAYGLETSAELVQVRDGVRTPVPLGSVQMTGTLPSIPTVYPDSPPDPAEIEECLTANGFTVQAAPPSAGVSYEDPLTGALSSEEQAERDRASQDCFLGTGRE